MVTLLLQLAPPPPPPPTTKVEESRDLLYHSSLLPPIPETSRLTKTFSYSRPLSNSDFKGCYHWLPPSPLPRRRVWRPWIIFLSSPAPAPPYNLDASNSGGGGCGDSSAQAEVKSVVSLSPSGRTRDICSNIIMVQFTKPRTKPKQTSQCPPASFLYDWAVGWTGSARLQNTNLLMRRTVVELQSFSFQGSLARHPFTPSQPLPWHPCCSPGFSLGGRLVYTFVLMATQQQWSPEICSVDAPWFKKPEMMSLDWSSDSNLESWTDGGNEDQWSWCRL